jgi:hypothetical protein
MERGGSSNEIGVNINGFSYQPPRNAWCFGSMYIYAVAGTINTTGVQYSCMHTETRSSARTHQRKSQVVMSAVNSAARVLSLLRSFHTLVGLCVPYFGHSSAAHKQAFYVLRHLPNPLALLIRTQLRSRRVWTLKWSHGGFAMVRQ